jgi:rhamnose utilization protein RhaD (predicted bifunctional aldolase and dehydrogenase)
VSDPRPELIQLAHDLGREDRHLAILGEGNVSAPGSPGTFWVKASGSSLGTLQENQLTQVRSGIVLQALDQNDLDDHAVLDVLRASQVSADAALPSVETFLHAVALNEGGAACVGHVHPVSVLGLLCARGGLDAFQQHLFPDAIVVCGRHLATVPYLDPGLALARAFRASLRAFTARHGHPPRVLLMENHGPVALGASAKDVLNILLMLDKWARILATTLATGGPQYLPQSESDRIDARPDEHIRRQQILGTKP